ncbi:MAG: hypothetical protein GY696_28605, partial [Gammaproteobacteria bacterium]|nr:hypothetical protein [Gammaproteobacteria bacterium]
MELQFTKLSARARTPTRSSDRATGFDLYPRCDYTIPAHSRRVCLTDIAIELPSDHYGRICSNRKLAVMHEIVVETGPIDDTHIGQIGILLHNHGQADYRVNTSEPIAHPICERISIPKLRETCEFPRTKKLTPKASNPVQPPATRHHSPKDMTATRILRTPSRRSTLVILLCMTILVTITTNIGVINIPKYWTATDKPSSS